jgi:hypothetical protein
MFFLSIIKEKTPQNDFTLQYKYENKGLFDYGSLSDTVNTHYMYMNILLVQLFVPYQVSCVNHITTGYRALSSDAVYTTDET